MEADLVVIDLASTAAIEQATRRAEDIWQALFPTIMLGDDRAVREIWVGGRERQLPKG
jgi:guanine deaminase